MNSDCMNERASLRHVLGKRALVYIGILVFAFVLLLVLNANSGSASAVGPTYVHDDISVNTPWTEANSPYIVNDSITILPGATLTIGPNVTVMVDPGESITVSGRLVAQGTADLWITFTSNDSTPARGDWNGLYFDHSISGSILSYVTVQYAWTAVEILNTSVAISNVELIQNGFAGLWWVVDDGSDLTAALSNVNSSDNWYPATSNGHGMFFMADGGNATVTIADSIAMNNYASGIVVQATGDVDVTISGTDVESTNDVSILLYSTEGSIVADLSNIAVEGSGSFGVLVWAPNGDATVTVDPSWIGLTDDSGLQVEALGSVDVSVVDTMFVDCYVGLSVYGENGDVTLDLTNVTFSGCFYGLVADVTSADLMLTYSVGLLEDNFVAAALTSIGGNVTVQLDNISLAGNFAGIDVESGLDSVMTIVDSTFDGEWVGEVWVNAGGDATVSVTRTTMSGESAALNVNYYPVEIEAEYDIINPDTNTTTYAMYVDLPFDFPYAGGVYDYVYVYAYGIISVGALLGSFPVDIYGSSERLIIPCQDYFYADSWPYVGYKVYDDRIVFQWYVWQSYGPSYLKDVFEVVLYPNGDIQFNYADMETVNDWAPFDYGLVTGGFIPIRLNDIMEANVYDMDYRSVYFSMEEFNDGWAIEVDAVGDVTATVTDSSVSHYLLGGIGLWSDNGKMSVEVMNSTIDYIMSYGMYGSGIVAWAYNGTMTASLEDSTFDHINVMAAAFVSDPLWGGEETVTITGCTFEQIGYQTVWISTDVYDDDGFNAVVDYVSTRTITENTFMDAAGVSTSTFIESYDSAWNVTMTETMTNNTFTGNPPFVGYIITSLPTDAGLFEGLLVSHSQILSAVDGEAKVKKTAVVTGNYMEGQLWMGPESAPLQTWGLGISVQDSVIVDGGSVVVWDDAVTITDNTLNATFGYFNDAIYVELWGDLSDGQLNSTLMADVSNNDLLAESWLGWNGIDVEIWQWLEYGLGNGSVVGDISIENNVIQNVWWAIYAYIGAGIGNQWGSQTADFTVSVVDNNVTGTSTYGGIEVEIEADSVYDGYFPPYETEVSASQTTTYAVDIAGNYVEKYGEGIYVYLTSNVREDNYGVFAHAMIDVNGTVDISNNEIVDTSSYGYYGIYVDWYEHSEFGQAAGEWMTGLMIANNAVTGPVDGSQELGIYVYKEVEAWTYGLRFDDSPTATSVFDSTITENVVTNSADGITVEPYVWAYYGSSSAVVDDSFVVSKNEVSGSQDVGILGDLEAWTSQYSEYGLTSNANANVTWSLLITENTVDWIADESDPDGIYVGTRFTPSDIDDMYLTLTTMFEISSNTITGVGGEDGIAVDSDSASVVTYEILSNTITGTMYDGIDVDDSNVIVSRNTMSGMSDDGIYIYYSTGEISNNTITGTAYGIDVYDCWLLTINDNVIDMCGDGIYVEYLEDSNITANTLTNNGLEGDDGGLYIYDSYNVTVADNEITGNLQGMYVEYSSLITVTNNIVSGNLHGGAGFYSISDLTVEGNTFNENGDDGVWLEYCDNLIFGNNTANENAGDGVYIYNYYYGTTTIYNGEYAENTWYGLYVEIDYSGADWIVDAVAEVRNNEVYIDGDVNVVSGGVLTLDAVFDFIMGYDDRDGVAEINVAEGGTLIVMNSLITYEYGYLTAESPTNGYYYYEFNVLGTLDMESSTVEEAKELYLGPTSSANIRTSTIYNNYRNGINIEDCSPVISGTTIYSNGMDGIFIEGANAAPKITDCLISGNSRGIYAYKSSLANVVDNLIVLNDIAGIYAYDSDGKIHDNVLLFNQREIWIKDSTVSVVSNQIGYSVLLDVMAKYLPLLSMSLEVPILDGVVISPELMVMMMLNHIGIYAENSTVSASDNVYGMLTYAVYVVDSQLTFNDRVVASELTIPYFDSNGMLWNITVPIHVYDGIYASGSSVTVNGGYIEVLDDAIFLEASTADLRNVVLNATDVDLYLIDGSTASATEVTFDGKIIIEDSSVLTVNYKLTVIAVDQDGQPVGGVWIVVWNAAKESVAEGATGDDGTFVTYVVGYVQTSAGKSAAMNPYLVNASFDQGSVEKSVTVEGPTEVTVQVPVEKVKPIEMAPIIAIVLIGIVLVAMLLLVVRGRL